MKPTLSVRRMPLLLATALLSLSAAAQKSPQQIEEMRQKILTDQHVKDVQISSVRQTPSFIQLQKQQGYNKALSKSALENYLGVRSGVDYLVQDRVTTLPNGIEVIEYQQYFKGVKVDFAKFKAFVKNDQVSFFNGAWYDVPAGLAVQAGISKDAALNAAKRRVGAKKYATEVIQEKLNAAKDLQTKQLLQQELENSGPKGELVLVKDFNKQGLADVKLAYKFDMYAAEPLRRDWVYVDASNGSILLVNPIIKHANPNPPASSIITTVQTRYAGNRSIYVKQVSGTDPNSGLPLLSSHPTSELTYLAGAPTWLLMDDTRGGGVETYDLNGVGGLPLSLPSLYLQGKSFTDADNNWTLAEHKRGGGEDGALEAENDDIAWDAHWGAEMVYDYWKNRQNRLSFDNNNSKIKSFVHYGPAYDNAFWNGSVMTYGDGSGPAAGGFKALTSLDVCGHEIGHGVCEYTANLVYEKESGAMNEAFSDIWAACVEHFAITQIDPSLKSTYRPFYIGEQISASPDVPLRRMDNPKAAGNPDTYGGQNWDTPDCSPDLTNDYCGVHNNSGLLNKWFYLITIGSGAGSGPDASYARAGADDGVNDLGKTYSVTGLGFDQSERIAYLTELLLTSTATYAEARDMSIQVATDLSGSPCSALVETVTNAWYAIGVGTQFVKPCSVTYGFISKSSMTISEASTPAGCASEKTVSIPVILPAGSTATISVTATATQGQDYTLSTTSLSNTTTQVSKQNINVVIKNDAIIEGDESITLKLSVTNAGTNPVNNTYVLTILDDDVTPVIGNGSKNILSESFTAADGFAEPAGWTEVQEIAENTSDPTAPMGLNQWGVFGGKLAITGKDGITGLQLPAGTYNPLSESKTFVKSPLIDARGLSQLKMSFDYRVQGEVDPQSINPGNPDIETLPVFDYMAVLYSLDGVNWVELNSGDFRPFASLLPSSNTFTGFLPASLGNKQFYIAFRWYNDANAGGPESVQIDNLVLEGAPRKIENDLGNNGRENAVAGQEVYFYSLQDGDVLGRIKNGSAKDFGCTNVYVEKAGNGAFNLYQTKDALHKVADKVVRIEASYLYNAATTVTLYYTEAQLQGLELASGHSRTEFGLYKVDAVAYSSASGQNTRRYAAAYTELPGVGGYYTISFTDKVNGSYALGVQVSSKGLLLQSQSGAIAEEASNTNWKFGTIYPNPGTGKAYLSVSAPAAHRVKLEVINVSGQVVYTRSEQVSAGTTLLHLPAGGWATGTYMVRLRDEDGKTLHAQQYIRN